MIDQLDIFSIVPDCSSRELPTAALPINPKVEEAIAALREIKQIVIAQFQPGTRVVSGDLHGEVDSIIDEILCMVRFDGELKPRQVFTDSLSVEYKPVLVEGCTVRSPLYFKGKTAKVISFYQIGTVTMANVELKLNGHLTKFPCGISALEVVE